MSKLEPKGFYVAKLVDADIYARMEHFSEYDIDYLEMKRVLYLKVMGEKLETFSFPTTWVDAVKARWFPGWLLRRYPASYTKIDITALYPKLSLPDEDYRFTLDSSQSTINSEDWHIDSDV